MFYSFIYKIGILPYIRRLIKRNLGINSIYYILTKNGIFLTYFEEVIYWNMLSWPAVQNIILNFAKRLNLSSTALLDYQLMNISLLFE